MAYKGSCLDRPHHDGYMAKIRGDISHGCGYLALASANVKMNEMIRLCTNAMFGENVKMRR
jgi:hypothetical protein